MYTSVQHTSTGPVDNVLLKMMLGNLDLDKSFKELLDVDRQIVIPEV